MVRSVSPKTRKQNALKAKKLVDLPKVDFKHKKEQGLKTKRTTQDLESHKLNPYSDEINA